MVPGKSRAEQIAELVEKSRQEYRQRVNTLESDLQKLGLLNENARGIIANLRELVETGYIGKAQQILSVWEKVVKNRLGR